MPNLNLGGSSRPNRIGEGRVAANAQPGKKGADFPWYDLSAFESVPRHSEDGESPAAGCITQSAHGFSPFAFGNSGRNVLDGPGLVAMNMALSKNFRIKEGHNLQLRLEPFNFLNHTSFVTTDEMTRFDGLTGGLLSRVGAWGRGGGPRIFQSALKHRF